ncbi:FxSxx-COOH system tetratricopeptide repeat protein [Streptomyces sp. NPDC002328]|uniref:FxSxx-COOH system tetratricopeptide repeat protein n=1 Tax=Streptomyces sp. NPDC002328 TaxID=3364642 RepID=UPI0036C42437
MTQRRSPVGLDPRDVADALWLASAHPWLTEAADTRPDDPSDGGRGDASGGSDRLPPGAAQEHDRPDSEDASAEAQASASAPGADAFSASHADAPDPDVLAEGPWPRITASHALPAALRPAPSPGERPFGPRAWGLALRPFRTAVASAYTSELDEDATAHRIALAPFLPPVLRPAPERRWRAVLLVDTAPQMAVWQGTAEHFAKALRRLGGFRDVTELSLDVSSAEQAVVTLPGPALGARPLPHRSLIDLTGRSLVFVLTDGVAPAWRSGAAQWLLAQWSRRQPVTVLHTLPQRLWHRTGLHPTRVRLRAASQWVAGQQPDWEPAEALSSILGSLTGPGVTVPVPVLEPRPEWLEPWARFVGGDRPRDLVVAAVLTSTGARPEPPVPPSASDPGAQVAAFRGWASPEAFQLATHMAAIPLDLPTMADVQQRTITGTSTEHLAEFLVSGLVSPLLSLDDGRSAFAFGDGIREELLAYGSRSVTEQVIRQAAELKAPHSAAARNLLAYLQGQDATPAPADDTDGEFRFIERAVLGALSGRHVQRATELDALDRREPAWSDVLTVGTPPGPPTEPGDPWPPEDTDPPVSAIPTASGPPTGPQLLSGIPPRNPRFAGRTTLLNELRSKLRSHLPLPIALHGLGGVGKTQLITEYVYRHGLAYDLVGWIPADQPNRTLKGFVDLAGRMGLDHGGEGRRAVRAVLEALRTGAPYATWLLVFDEAEDPESLRPYLPSQPARGGFGSVIVTSRNPRWDLVAESLEVNVLERPESIELFRQRNPRLTVEEANSLAEILGDLPLALEQASTWFSETGMPPAEYVRLFEERGAELLSLQPPLQYEGVVATTWNLSLEHVGTRNPGALQLLRLCSHLAPDPIPRRLFSHGRLTPIAPEIDHILRDPLMLARALREINRFSLARIYMPTNSIQMHRLLQHVLKAQMTEEESEHFRSGALQLLAAVKPHDPSDPRDWPDFDELYPHVIATSAWESKNPYVRQLVYDMARYLFHLGEHRAALDFSDRVDSAWRRSPSEYDSQALLLALHRRLLLWSTGHYAEASALTEQVLAAFDAIMSEEDRLRAESHVTSDRRTRGDFRGALELAEDIHARSLRFFGPEDPESLVHGANLAVCLRVNGDFQRAHEVDEYIWQQRVELMGASHPLALEAEAAVMLDRLELGRYREALAMAEEYLGAVIATYGESHPAKVRATVRLAVAQRRAGLLSEAVENTGAALRALTGRYGERALDVLHTALNHSVNLRHIGDLGQALHLGEGTRDHYADVLAPTHPLTLTADVNLAVTLRLLGRANEARDLDASAVDRFTEALGSAHPCTLIAGMNLANDRFVAGDLLAARSLDEGVLDRMEVHLGVAHPLTLMLRLNLATDLRALGHTSEGMTQHERAAAQLGQQLGGEHPVLLAARSWQRIDADIDPAYL